MYSADGADDVYAYTFELLSATSAAFPWQFP